MRKNINTGGIGIGDASSEFVIPLANIRVGSDELLAGNGDITAMFGDVEGWIPASYKFIEVQRLGDSRYIDQWSRDLCAGMDDAAGSEFARVVEQIHRTRMEDFRNWVTPSTDFAAYKRDFERSWNGWRRSEIERKIGETVAAEVAALDTEVAPVDYAIENEGLDDEVIDMLVDGRNDDALELFGTILNRMKPIKCTLKAEFVDTPVGFEVTLPAARENTDAQDPADGADNTGTADKTDPAVAIPAVKIPAKDARAIIRQGLLRVTVTPVEFYPRTAYDQGEQMLVQLKLRRKGGLKVNL